MGRRLDIYDVCAGHELAEEQLLALREVSARAYDLATALLVERAKLSRVSREELDAMVDDLATAIAHWHGTGGA